MTIKRMTAGLATAAALLGLTTQAVADHDNRAYRATTVSNSAYARNAGPVYDYAHVISSRPIVRYVTVTTPVKECWQDTQNYTVHRRPPGVGGSTLVGAIIGGVIGHQFGSHRGNDAATVAGTLLGAAIGNSAAYNRNAGQYGPEQHSRPVKRCETKYREHQEERIDGYDVIYQYHGRKYATRTPFDPGKKLKIRVDVRPAS